MSGPWRHQCTCSTLSSLTWGFYPWFSAPWPRSCINLRLLLFLVFPELCIGYAALSPVIQTEICKWFPALLHRSSNSHLHLKKDETASWKELTVQSSAWRIKVWGLGIKTQVSSEVVPFQSSKFGVCLATNILPCSISPGVSFWTTQYSVYSSSQ